MHGTSSHQTTFNELVGIASKNFTILAGTRLTFVSIDNEVTGAKVEIKEKEKIVNQYIERGKENKIFIVFINCLPSVQRLVHETPLKTSGETSTTTTTQTGFLHFLKNPFVTLEQDFLRLVPVTTLHGALQTEVVLGVDVGENAVVIRQATERSFAIDGIGVGIGLSSIRASYCRNNIKIVHES
jgi:hypothetical protein